MKKIEIVITRKDFLKRLKHFGGKKRCKNLSPKALNILMKSAEKDIQGTIRLTIESLVLNCEIEEAKEKN